MWEISRLVALLSTHGFVHLLLVCTPVLCYKNTFTKDKKESALQRSTGMSFIMKPAILYN